MDRPEEHRVDDHCQPELIFVGPQNSLINESAADHFLRRRLHEDRDEQDQERQQLKSVKIQMDITVHPCHQDRETVHTDADRIADHQIEDIVACAACSVCLKKGPVLFDQRVQEQDGPYADE